LKKTPRGGGLIYLGGKKEGERAFDLLWLKLRYNLDDFKKEHRIQGHETL
jgi:hypothetical protein